MKLDQKCIFNLAINQLSLAKTGIGYLEIGLDLDKEKDLQRYELVKATYALASQAIDKLKEFHAIPEEGA